MDHDALEKGRDFEKQTASFLGAKLVPGSGNQWHAKLDVGKAGGLLASLKWSRRDPIPRLSTLMRETSDAITAPGGVGLETIGAVILGAPGKRSTITLYLDDFARVVEEDLKLTTQSKVDAKLARARTPVLFRDLEN